MKVSVIGTGYVGLVAGACFADSGNHVTCVDINAEKIAKLSEGIPVIYEPGLEDLLKRNIRESRLTFSTDIAKSVDSAEVIFIAVGTPQGEDGSADLQYVLAVAADIGKYMNSYKVVVNKSTVPVGTAAKVKETISSQLAHRQADFAFDVISNPEFLKEGTAIDDFMRPDRIVIGGEHEKAIKIMQRLYAPFLRTDNRIYVMDNKSAEITKYAANALLATKISFMNEIALMCDQVGANVDLVRQGIGSDVRIGSKFLFPGIGYGGSCFPKDVQALIRTGNELGVPMQILESVEKVNKKQKTLLLSRISSYFAREGQTLEGKVIAVWGLAFKPKTDDMREAPSIEVVNGLLGAGATVVAFDPVAEENAKSIWGDRIRLVSDQYQTLMGADCLVIHTEWNEFRSPDFTAMKQYLKTPVIFDGRNLYNVADMRDLGIEYHSIGRGNP